jgi:hypothetical protein
LRVGEVRGKHQRFVVHDSGVYLLLLFGC